METIKRITLDLNYGDNAFKLLGAFTKQAQKEKWTKAEIDAVIEKAMSGDYDYLCEVLSERCTTD